MLVESSATAHERVGAMDPFDQLVEECGLVDDRTPSPDGLQQRSLFSRDNAYRYAFARWWGEPDLSRSVVWVMLNPSSRETNRTRRPTLDRVIARSKAWGLLAL